ncbi:MAG: glycosyltransferase [Parcubacteria group bacterium]|nr:glycosyltransferase [Parcubacteria group bacterium]
MKILIQTRPDLFKCPAGDTIQILNTQKQLRSLAVSCEIDFNWRKDLSGADIVHIFNTNPPDYSYAYWVNARKQGKPVVLTPIIIDLEEYNPKGRYGIDRILYNIGSVPFGEVIKSIYLAASDGGYRALARRHGLGDNARKIKELIEGADRIAALSNLEKKYLCVHYKINNPIEVVYNGVDAIFCSSPLGAAERDCLLCAGKIEPLKNQIRVIQAYQRLGIADKLIFIGRPNLRHPLYFQKFQFLISQNPSIKYFPQMAQKELRHFYRRAKAHILASWFENAPLVNLEAAVCGCRIVSTNRGFGREYLGDYAHYCDPSSVDSIAQAIWSAYNAAPRPEMAEYAARQYSWKRAAEQLIMIYRTLMQ